MCDYLLSHQRNLFNKKILKLDGDYFYKQQNFISEEHGNLPAIKEQVNGNLRIETKRITF